MSEFLRQHFENLEELLKSQSRLCQPALPSYDIGINREFFVREVLRTHLPTFCEITSGSVIDTRTPPSGQIDILVYQPLCLRANIGSTDCLLSGSIFSAIEVKSRLSGEAFATSAKMCAQLHALERGPLYTGHRGHTDTGELYHFNTIGTVVFAYKSLATAEACVEHLQAALEDQWPARPEAVYSLDRGFLLVRDDYLQWVDRESEKTWIQRCAKHQVPGYAVIDSRCLLILVAMMAMRIQANYHLLPVIPNYIS